MGNFFLSCIYLYYILIMSFHKYRKNKGLNDILNSL